MCRVEANSYPTLVIYLIDDMGDLLKSMAEIATLAGCILNDGSHSVGLFQRDVDRFGNPVEAGIDGYLVQMASRMEVKPVDPQLLTPFHLVIESGPRLVQALLLRMPQVDQVTGMWQDMVG
ncbi:hypothetical protein SDC9_123593 [bioreactor metagenome]|uniref:Uncharacterized protein n=1 Tax=bioreactor metagenome TaxID=1076179 RepID=A0A645CI60_9ZZZZ